MHKSAWRRKPYPVSPYSASTIRTERHDWTGLEPQARVIVQEGRGTSYEAVVDILTEDMTVVWVLPTALTGRRAFHHNDDVDITVVSGRKLDEKKTGGDGALTRPNLAAELVQASLVLPFLEGCEVQAGPVDRTSVIGS